MEWSYNYKTFEKRGKSTQSAGTGMVNELQGLGSVVGRAGKWTLSDEINNRIGWRVKLVGIE